MFKAPVSRGLGGFLNADLISIFSGLLQISTSLASLRSVKRPSQVSSALSILEAGARDLKSRDLGLLVQRINALADAGPHDSDLSSIKGLLEKLLANLEATADSEIEHQAFCKKELAGNNRTRAKQTDALESVSAPRVAEKIPPLSPPLGP